MINIGSAVADSGTSSVFRTSVAGKVWMRLGGTTVADVTLKESLDNSTFATFNVAGTDQAFTAAQYKLFDLPGGVYFRFDVGTGNTAVEIDIDGGVIDIQ